MSGDLGPISDRPTSTDPSDTTGAGLRVLQMFHVKHAMDELVSESVSRARHGWVRR